jgi:hypothetical protein
VPHIRADLAVPCERDRSHTIRMGTATLNLMLAAGTLVSMRTQTILFLGIWAVTFFISPG